MSAVSGGGSEVTVANRSVDGLKISVRAANALHRAGIHTVGALACRTEAQLLSEKYFGRRCLREVKEALAWMGLSLASASPPPVRTDGRQPGRLPPNRFHEAAWIVGDRHRIAPDTWIGAFCVIDAIHDDLTIGDGSVIAAGAQVYTHSTVRRTAGAGPLEHAPTWIGERVSVCAGAIVLMGCKVGHHSIVGAGVTLDQFTDLPPYSLVRESRPVRASHMLDPDALVLGAFVARPIDGQWQHPTRPLAEEIAYHADMLLGNRKAGHPSDDARSVVVKSTRGRSHRELARVWLNIDGEVRTWVADAPPAAGHCGALP